jgi:DNA-binding CsgD family transcriptional regulator
MDRGIVGRDQEIATAEAFLDSLSEGAAGLLIEGDVGIGKTALWRHLLESAEARGYRVLRCIGDRAEARLSFLGLIDLLVEVGDEELGRLRPLQRAALDVALVRHGPGPRRVPDAKTVALGAHSVLVSLAEAGPVLLAIDDVQWLDKATAFVLAFVAKRIGGHRIGVVATVRGPHTSSDPLGLDRALGPERVQWLHLGPLSVGALGVLLETRLGHRHPMPVLVRLAEVSGGNPLFALEVAQALGPAPVLDPGAPLPVPESLRELLVRQVTKLPSEGRLALLAAAALSHPRSDVVEAASSVAGLAAAEEAGLLRQEGDRVVFAHPLYAAVVYRSASVRRRRAMHERLAALAGDSEERARHLALAGKPPDKTIADALDTAAAGARARGAWNAAAELLELGHRFTPPEQAYLGRSRLVRAAEHHVHAGDRPRARALLEDVLAATPSGPLRSEALRLLAEIHQNEDSFEQAERLLEEALVYADDPASRVVVLVALAFVSFNRGALDRSDRYATLARTEAATLGDDGRLAEALAIQAMVDFLSGRGVDWKMVEQALALEDPGRLVALPTRPRTVDAALTLFIGRPASARQKLNALRDAARESGDESDLSAVLWWLSSLETAGGNLLAAASLADEGIEVALLTGSESGRAYLLGQRALVHAHLGNIALARADAAEAARICASIGFWQPMLFVGSALGLLELSLGNPAAAWAAVRDLTENAETRAILEPHLHQYLPAALEALVALGEFDRAERLLDRFEARAREVDRTWALAHAARARGQLGAARGDLEGAEAHLRSALSSFNRLMMPFPAARTLLVLGQVKRRRRQRRAAREALEEALGIFEGQGAVLWAERCRAELGVITSRHEPGTLTAAEQRVVELAAEGHPNKEIAGRLFLSVHTVELHLSHAYAKLGVRSRAELAHRMTTRL